MDSVETCSSASTGWHLTQNSSGDQMAANLFQKWHSFPTNVYDSLLYSLHMHIIWKRSVEEYKSQGALSKTTHFLSMFCEAGVVQQCTEEQADTFQKWVKT